MTELDVAHNKVTNKRFVPLPVFSFNNQGEVDKDVMPCEGLQSNNRVDPPTKDPNRVLEPRSAYILFSKAERQLILNELCPELRPPVNCKSYLDDAIAHPELPARYQNAGIANPLVVMKKECRKHCKTNGKIAFVKQSKMMSYRWKTADSETKSYFGSLAMADVIRFKTEVSEKVESHTQSQACSAITYTNFGDNAQNADILRVIQKAPSQALATFNQVKETNRAIRKYDQNEATMHALQTTPETIFPTSVGEVSKNPRNNQKRKTTGLSGQNDLCRTESFLGQKRSMTELDVAHNRVANK
eukprot:4700538-Ditylum_brightwellii.AAC.1